MKKIVQMTALLILTGSITIWVLMGANTGWTTTETEVHKVDEITGIEYTEYIPELIPGIELLIVGIVTALLVMGISFFIKNSRKITTS